MSASTDSSFRIAARNGVGVLGVTLLTQVGSAEMIATTAPKSPMRSRSVPS
jgi:hypothetical protein